MELSKKKQHNIYDNATKKKIPVNHKLNLGFHANYLKIGNDLNLLIPKYIQVIKSSDPLKILDAGCGVGTLATRIDFSVYNAELYGVDEADVSVAVVRSKRKYKHVCVSSLEQKLPYKTSFFDFIISNEMLSYCDTNAPLFELFRVVKQGGFVMMTMRTNHFVERNYPGAIKELEETGKCIILRQKRY